jgi:type II secretory pathway pseudopilin PulG
MTVPTRSSRRAAPAESRCAGFTLIELMSILVLMTVGILGVLTTATRVNALRKLDEELAMALRACKSTMEDIRGLPIADVLTLEGFDVPGRDGQGGGLPAVPGDPDGLPGHVSVTVDQTGGGVTLYRVTLEVEWARGTASQKFSFQSLLIERK